MFPEWPVSVGLYSEVEESTHFPAVWIYVESFMGRHGCHQDREKEDAQNDEDGGLTHDETD